jgi:hypothetical protein
MFNVISKNKYEQKNIIQQPLLRQKLLSDMHSALTQEPQIHFHSLENLIHKAN